MNKILNTILNFMTVLFVILCFIVSKMNFNDIISNILLTVAILCQVIINVLTIKQNKITGEKNYKRVFVFIFLILLLGVVWVYKY